MVCVQVYLTERQLRALALLGLTTGKRRSKLIREAVSRMLEQSASRRREIVLDRAAGIWKHRRDLFDSCALRCEWDRARRV
jgi:hypothetical protein